MSLRTSVDAYYKEPCVQVKYAGRKSKDVLSVDISETINDSLMTATITHRSNPGIEPEAYIQIAQGYDGQYATTFTGYVDSVEYNEFQETYVVNCRDPLKKALDTFLIQEVAFGIQPETGMYYYSTYTSVSGGTFQVHQYDSIESLNLNHPETTGNYSNQGVKAEAVVQWLLHMSGLQEGTEIQVDDTNFWIGDTAPAKFQLTSVYDAALQIANLIGWRIYCTPNGVAHFQKRPRNASNYPQWTYTDRSEPHNIFTLKRTTTNSDLRNYVEVRGSSGIVYVARAASPYIGNTPYRGAMVSNELIDTPDIASFMGNRILADLNRLKDTVELSSDGNPFVHPGMSIYIKSSKANGTFMVESVSTTMSAENGYKGQVTAVVFPGDTEYEEEPSTVVAAFGVTQTVSIGDPKYITNFDASASYSNRGTIVLYYWEWPDGSNWSSSNPQATYIFDETQLTASGGARVGLVVRDSLGNIGSTEQYFTLSGLVSQVNVMYRHLYAAMTDQAAGSLDTGLNWNTQAIPAISVAASNFMNNGQYAASGYALFGTSDGKVYRTFDGNMSVVPMITDTGTFPHVHIAELDGNYALASQTKGSKGILYRSVDAGVTWIAIHEFDTPIIKAEYHYMNRDAMQVLLSGNSQMYDSFDGGQSFTSRGIIETMNWFDSGMVSNYYAHTSGIYAVTSGQGRELNFPDVSPHNIVAMTIAIDDDQGTMAADDTGKLWTYGYNEVGHNILAGTYYPTNKTRHMIRDGELPVVYLATESGVSKSLDQAFSMQELYYPQNYGSGVHPGTMVAYGPLSDNRKDTGNIYFYTTSTMHELATGIYNDMPNNTGAGLFGFTAYGQPFKILDVATPVPDISFIAGHIYLSDFDSIQHVHLLSSGTYPVRYNDWGSAPLNQIIGLRRVFSPVLSTIDANNAYVIATTASGSMRVLSYTNYGKSPQYAGNTMLTYDGSSAVASLDGAYATLADPNTDTYLITNKPSIISIQSELWAMSGISVADYRGFNEDSYYPVRYSKFSGAYRSIGRTRTNIGDYNDSVFYFTDSHKSEDDDKTFNLTATNMQTSDVLKNFPGNTFGIESIYASAQRRSSVYYATDTGVYNVSGFGYGGELEIYTPPEGYRILGFSVTHDIKYVKDYLCIAIRSTTADLAGKYTITFVYSTDAGVTFTIGPSISHGFYDINHITQLLPLYLDFDNPVSVYG